MKLNNPTDDELNAAFAEKVAGWRNIMGYIRTRTHDRIHIQKGIAPDGLKRTLPPFTASADTVLPWLEKRDVEAKKLNNKEWCIDVFGVITSCVAFTGKSQSFPRAAVIALLRANGVEIEFPQ